MNSHANSTHCGPCVSAPVHSSPNWFGRLCATLRPRALEPLTFEELNRLNDEHERLARLRDRVASRHFL